MDGHRVAAASVAPRTETNIVKARDRSIHPHLTGETLKLGASILILLLVSGQWHLAYVTHPCLFATTGSATGHREHWFDPPQSSSS